MGDSPYLISAMVMTCLFCIMFVVSLFAGSYKQLVVSSIGLIIGVFFIFDFPRIVKLDLNKHDQHNIEMNLITNNVNTNKWSPYEATVVPCGDKTK